MIPAMPKLVQALRQHATERRREDDERRREDKRRPRSSRRRRSAVPGTCRSSGLPARLGTGRTLP